MAQRLQGLGATTVDRREGLSDNGGVVLNAHFGEIDDPATLAAELSAIPGVVEHGIFLADLVSTVVVADPDGTIEVLGLAPLTPVSAAIGSGGSGRWCWQSWARSGSASASTSGMIAWARDLPSSTPHWSKEFTSQIAPWVNTLCS